MRVKPIIESVNPSTIFTTVQWTFPVDIEDSVKKFRVICLDANGQLVDIDDSARPTLRNVAKFKNTSLVPENAYCVKVLAVYEDGFESESEPYQFTSPCKYHNTAKS